MLAAETAIVLAIFLPLVGGADIVLAGRHPNLREAVTLITSLLLLLTVLMTQ